MLCYRIQKKEIEINVEIFIGWTIKAFYDHCFLFSINSINVISAHTSQDNTLRKSTRKTSNNSREISIVSTHKDVFWYYVSFMPKIYSTPANHICQRRFFHEPKPLDLFNIKMNGFCIQHCIISCAACIYQQCCT